MTFKTFCKAVKQCVCGKEGGWKEVIFSGSPALVFAYSMFKFDDCLHFTGTFGRIFHGVLLDEKDPSKEKQVFVKTVKGTAAVLPSYSSFLIISQLKTDMSESVHYFRITAQLRKWGHDWLLRL